MSVHLYMSRLDLPLAERRATILVLQARLSDALDLAAQLKQAHWNVRGPQFAALHLLFDTLAEEAEEDINEIAERGFGRLGNAFLHASAKPPQWDTSAACQSASRRDPSRA